MTPWVNKITQEHQCVKPLYDEIEPFLPGSIWQCPGCDQQWRYAPWAFDFHRWKKQEEK